ncbi:hypothetical protein EL17_18860 [Anditalea andensis]|uniref:Uncharacterized protein n=1 Tax=Anditalea andensis TaxID=1048983 RepID=A0A074KQP1_9BACT|nr:hypothetical protein EL17_18860 [Anditalea andensis]
MVSFPLLIWKSKTLYSKLKRQRTDRRILFLPIHKPNAKKQKSLFFYLHSDEKLKSLYYISQILTSHKLKGHALW